MQRGERSSEEIADQVEEWREVGRQGRLRDRGIQSKSKTDLAFRRLVCLGTLAPPNPTPHCLCVCVCEFSALFSYSSQMRAFVCQSSGMQWDSCTVGSL